MREPTTLNHLQLVPLSASAFNGGMALLLTSSVPVREPRPLATKLTVMVQVAFTAKVDGQVLICVKSPCATILFICSGAVPMLVSMTVCACAALTSKVLPKPNAVLLKRPRGTGMAVPLAIKSTPFTLVALAASLGTTMRATFVPSLMGLNAM